MLDVELPDRLRKRLQEPLPGRAAQRIYSHELSYGRHFGPPHENARNAAVLVLLRWNGEEWLLPMIRRVSGGVHSGQICFAGGGVEPGESPVEAAIRECSEEMGWAPQRTDVLGTLSPLYVFASNNDVQCVIAATTATPLWRPDGREVAELLEVPLKQLCSGDSKHEMAIRHHGFETRAKCFRWQSHHIWGATAMILSELTSIVRP